MGVEPFIGQVQPFAGTYPPRGWALCNGALLAVNSNQALFSLIGAMYGGDGRTTFGLPDLRGRVVVGAGNGPGLTPRNPGQTGGVASVALAQSQIPAHSHPTQTTASFTVSAATSKGSHQVPVAGDVLAGGYNVQYDANLLWYLPDAQDFVNLGGVSANPQVTINPAGASVPHNNTQPCQGINFIIALQGIYPSRN